MRAQVGPSQGVSVETLIAMGRVEAAERIARYAAGMTGACARAMRPVARGDAHAQGYLNVACGMAYEAMRPTDCAHGST